MGGVAARGSALLGFSSLLENGALLARAAVLASVLTPADFGLMGMALIAIQAGEALSQTGFHRALVQTRRDPAEYLDTVWIVMTLRGALLFGLAWLVSPIIAAFFATPEVVPILRTAGLAFLIQGLLNPALFVLEREFAFGRYMTPRLLGIATDLTVAVWLALTLRSVWAMVWGFLAGKTVFVLSSYPIRPWLPRFRFSLARVRELYGYGRHIFRMIAVNYLTSQADRVLVGRILGAEALGLYAFANRIATLPSGGLFSVVIKAAFPVFSRIQDQKERMGKGYLRALALLTAIAAPISAGLMVISGDLVPLAFGEKWQGMITPLQILCLGGISLALYYLIGAILSAVGRPDLSARGAYVFLGALILPLYPAIKLWGIAGSAGSVVAASWIAFTYLLLTSLPVVGCRISQSAIAIAPSLVGALLMAGSVLLVRSFLDGEPTWGLLAAEIGTGVVVFPLLTGALDRVTGGGLIASLRSALRASSG